MQNRQGHPAGGTGIVSATKYDLATARLNCSNCNRIRCLNVGAVKPQQTQYINKTTIMCGNSKPLRLQCRKKDTFKSVFTIRWISMFRYLAGPMGHIRLKGHSLPMLTFDYWFDWSCGLLWIVTGVHTVTWWLLKALYPLGSYISPLAMPGGKI